MNDCKTIFDTGCQLASGWSIIKAGAMAGVATSIGSVLLTLIGLRSAPPDGESDEDRVRRQFYFRLLLPNLLGMWVSSLFISLISGELTYARAAVMSVPAAAMFGISTLGAFVAIACAHMYSSQDSGGMLDVRTGLWLCRTVLFLATVEVVLDFDNAGNYLRNDLLDPWWLSLLVAFVVAAALAYISARSIAAKIANSLVSILPGQLCRKAREVVRDRPFLLCLQGIMAMVILYNIAAVRPDDQWSNSPGWLFYPLALLPLVYMLAMAFLLMNILRVQAAPPSSDASAT